MFDSFVSLTRACNALACAVIASAVAGTQGGCATVFCGTSESIRVDSIPSCAEVYMNGDFVGRTPLTLDLDRDTMPLLVLRKDEYADTRVQIDWRVNPGIVTNVFPGGILVFPILFGFVVDVRSGAACSYAEDDIVVPLLFAEEKEMSLYDGGVLLSNVCK